MIKKLLIILIVAMVGAVGFAGYWWWQEKGEKEVEMPKTEEGTVPEEIAGWKKYENEEWRITFHYPPEWGEVNDYMGPYIQGILREIKEVKAEESGFEGFRTTMKAMEEEGICLVFSNFGLDEFGQHGWGPQIRLTSVDKIKSRMSKYLTLASPLSEDELVYGKEDWKLLTTFPVLGSNMAAYFLYKNPEMISEFPKTIEKLAKMFSEKAEAITQEEIDNMFMVFAMGIREIKIKAIVSNADKTLRGVAVVGGEGFDVGARGFFDTILTPAEQNEKIIFISFNLDKSKEITEQEELYKKFVRNIKLLEDN